jgi:hypothetical protein
MDLREIEWGGMDWINLAQDRDQWRAPVNTASLGSSLYSLGADPTETTASNILPVVMDLEDGGNTFLTHH